MKTWSVALVLCLNIGVDPPDVVKTNPCARKECWIGELYFKYEGLHLVIGPTKMGMPKNSAPAHHWLSATLAAIAFLDPLSMSPQKGLELVGNNLQKQYERWQPRARYKQLLDPTTEEVRKLCLALRKNAKVTVELHNTTRYSGIKIIAVRTSFVSL